MLANPRAFTRYAKAAAQQVGLPALPLPTRAVWCWDPLHVPLADIGIERRAPHHLFDRPFHCRRHRRCNSFSNARHCRQFRSLTQSRSGCGKVQLFPLDPGLGRIRFVPEVAIQLGPLSGEVVIMDLNAMKRIIGRREKNDGVVLRLLFYTDRPVPRHPSPVDRLVPFPERFDVFVSRIKLQIVRVIIDVFGLVARIDVHHERGGFFTNIWMRTDLVAIQIFLNPAIQNTRVEIDAKLASNRAVKAL